MKITHDGRLDLAEIEIETVHSAYQQVGCVCTATNQTPQLGNRRPELTCNARHFG
ncbi:MAG TPA: hypothetical protein VFP43_09930 [Mesorhizobium sp.]|nr:hypothetical protein [Mesorhizobium sp.]